MEYPNDFNVSAFPAGKTLAVSRAMGIGISIMCFLAICLCGLLLWLSHSQTIKPVVIAVNQQGTEWRVINSDNNNLVKQPTEYAIQESVIANFVQDWFTVSQNNEQNERLWQYCRDDNACINSAFGMYGDKTCAIMCTSGTGVYSEFVRVVLPQYRANAKSGIYLKMIPGTLRITPVTDFKVAGGTWKITGTVLTTNGHFNILAYATISRDMSKYGSTMGYFVEKFSSYRVNE